MESTTFTATFSTGIVPVLPIRPQPISDEQAALQIKLLRQRQLRRDDVRELLIRRAERREVAR